MYICNSQKVILIQTLVQYVGIFDYSTCALNL